MYGKCFGCPMLRNIMIWLDIVILAPRGKVGRSDVWVKITCNVMYLESPKQPQCPASYMSNFACKVFDFACKSGNVQSRSTCNVVFPHMNISVAWWDSSFWEGQRLQNGWGHLGKTACNIPRWQMIRGKLSTSLVPWVLLQASSSHFRVVHNVPSLGVRNFRFSLCAFKCSVACFCVLTLLGRSETFRIEVLLKNGILQPLEIAPTRRGKVASRGWKAGCWIWISTLWQDPFFA